MEAIVAIEFLDEPGEGTLVDTEQLLTFERIVREGSFSRAAWSLDVAQPTVSARVRALEQAVGGPLFARSGRGAGGGHPEPGGFAGAARTWGLTSILDPLLPGRQGRRAMRCAACATENPVAQIHASQADDILQLFRGNPRAASARLEQANAIARSADILNYLAGNLYAVSDRSSFKLGVGLSSGAGILAEGRKGIRIRDGVITGFTAGVQLERNGSASGAREPAPGAPAATGR